jgi:2'-5' RNA ligase
VSLAVFSSADSQALVEATATFAESTAPFDLTLSHIGTFPTIEGIVYLGPTPSVHLLELHRAFHKSLSAAGIVSNGYYLPDQWVPHCTTATDLTPGQMARAVRICVEIFQPIEVTCAEIGVVSFRPVKSIATFPLSLEGES